MSWLAIKFEGPHRLRDFEAFRGAFIQLWMDRSDDDRAAVYVTRSVDDYPPDVVTAYLTPVAAELAGGLSGFQFATTIRPSADEVTLSVGNMLASDPAWAELPEADRQATREYLSSLEYDEPESIEVLTPRAA